MEKNKKKPRARVDIARNLKNTPMEEKINSLWIWHLNIIRPAEKGGTNNPLAEATYKNYRTAESL